MKTVGFSSTGPLAHKAMALYHDVMDVRENIDATATVNVRTGFFDYDGPRPVIVLLGEVEQLEGSFGSDISNVDFTQQYARPQVRFRYQLTNDELAELCLKGLFDNGEYGLKCPKEFKLSSWYLPVQVDCHELSGDAVREDDTVFAKMAPLLFFDIKNQFCINLPQDSSGYRLADYYPTVQHEEELETVRDESLIEFEPDYELKPETIESIFDKEPEAASEPEQKTNLSNVLPEREPTEFELLVQGISERADKRYKELSARSGQSGDDDLSLMYFWPGDLVDASPDIDFGDLEEEDEFDDDIDFTDLDEEPKLEPERDMAELQKPVADVTKGYEVAAEP